MKKKLFSDSESSEDFFENPKKSVPVSNKESFLNKRKSFGS